MEARRKSLLIGINYQGKNALQGCIQDVENVLEFLDWVSFNNHITLHFHNVFSQQDHLGRK